MSDLECLSVLARLHCGEATQMYLHTVVQKFTESKNRGSALFNFTALGMEMDELEAFEKGHEREET